MIELPPYPTSRGSYERFRVCGSFGFVAAHGPVTSEGIAVSGHVGVDVSLEEAQEAARLTTLNILSTLDHHVGLDGVAGVARIFVMVQAGPDFHEHHLVADAASALLVEALGEERGAHARGAVGMASLPLDMAVNIDAIVLLG